MLKRIAHITDTHTDDKTALDRGINPRRNLEETLEHIAEIGIDELIFTGDIGEDGTYEWVFNTLRKYKDDFKIVLGNHDSFTLATAHYKNTYPAGKEGLYYAYDDEFYKYIFLDSSASVIGSEQLQWLVGEITSQKNILVFIHHPILEVATGMDNIYPLENRQEINNLLQQCKSSVTIFCGHYHMPDKKTEGKITQYVTPAISFQVNKNASFIDIKTHSFGYRLITLTESAVNTQLFTNRYDYFSPRFLQGTEVKNFINRQ